MVGFVNAGSWSLHLALLESRRSRRDACVAYIPLSFAPGEAYQFDWSHEIVLLDGVTVTVKVLPSSVGPARAASTTIYGRLLGKVRCW
ncbi:hypothetical protein C8K44_1014 [Aminobacter sp. AP02]|nr:hypothetical protein C8K44_1014 [Aminobacter sp. AP02]